MLSTAAFVSGFGGGLFAGTTLLLLVAGRRRTQLPAIACSLVAAIGLVALSFLPFRVPFWILVAGVASGATSAAVLVLLAAVGRLQLGSSLADGWLASSPSRASFQTTRRSRTSDPVAESYVESQHARARAAVVVAAAVAAAAAILALVAPNAAATLFRLTIVVMATVLPAVFQMRFLSTIGTLRDEYILNLYRLGIDVPRWLPEPPRHTSYHEAWRRANAGATYEVEATANVYEDKFASRYGLTSSGVWPVGLLCAAFAIGWVVIGNYIALSTNSALLDALLSAFVGCYIAIVMNLARQYVTHDLSTASFLVGFGHLVVALVVTFVLYVMWGLVDGSSAVLNVLSFATGFVISSNLLISALRAAVASLDRQATHELRLSKLDGMSVWTRTRLSEVGIDNIQALATANLADTLLAARVPLQRLVDWVDQALLYLHLTGARANKQVSGEDDAVLRLRRLGIRTATDLTTAVERADHATLASQAEVDGAVLRVTAKVVTADPNYRLVCNFMGARAGSEPRARSSAVEPVTDS